MNLRKHLVIALFLLCVAPLQIDAQDKHFSTQRPGPRSWLILPAGASGGTITAQTTEAGLTRTYGKANVVAQAVDLGEGETELGTTLFPADPVRQVEILWKDPLGKRWPKRVQISGGKSLWRTVHGISLGTTLKNLEQLNRKPFLLTGFDWDYSGTVVSWNNGALGQELDHPGRVLLRLMPSHDHSQRLDYSSVEGDRDFSSRHPAMQKLHPAVYQLIWFFP